MPSNARYTVPAIQRMRASRIKKRKKEKKKGLQAAIFLNDVLFCIIAALALILLLYWLNNGAFRAAAPLCMALGFYLCRLSVSKYIRVALQWGVFGVETLVYTLCLPFKHLFIWVAKNYKKSAAKRHQARLIKQRKNYTKQELMHIDRVAARLLPIDSTNRMQKGDNRAKQSKKAV